MRCLPNTKNERTPAYRHHKPSKQAVITLNGRDFYLGPFGSPASRQAYDRLLAELLVAGRSIPVPATPHNGLTITELTASYWRHAQVYYVKDGRPTSELPCIRQALIPGDRLARQSSVEFPFDGIPAQALSLPPCLKHLKWIGAIQKRPKRSNLVPLRSCSSRGSSVHSAMALKSIWAD